MLLIHYINLTHFQNDTTYYPLLRAYLQAEFVLYILDILQMAFFIWVIVSARQFHFNFTVILVFLYSAHLLDDVAIVTMRLQMFTGLDDTSLSSNAAFVSLMNFSIFVISTTLCIMPLTIMERCFATIFLSDYETHPRGYISFLLLSMLTILGCVVCYHLRCASNTIYFAMIILSLNAVALAVNFILRFYNRRQHKKFGSGGSQYSLAKRFQISENIKTLYMLNIIIFYMGCMNFLVVTSVMISGFPGLSPEAQAVCAVVLDVSIFVYSFSLSHIITCCCEKWKRHLTETMRKIGCLKASAQVEPLRDTFGTEMTAKASAESHFNALRSTWNVPTQSVIMVEPVADQPVTDVGWSYEI